MYADRFTPSPRLHPTSLAAAVGLNAAVLAALIFSAPEIVPAPLRTIMTTIDIPLPDPTPPPPEPQPEPVARARPQPRPVERIVNVPDQRADALVVTNEPLNDYRPPIDVALPPPPLPIPTLTPLPTLVAARADPRHARDFQPTYPASERRAGAEGVVRVAVVIGTDGRVRAVERLSATSDAFWHATERQALTRWRFRPATRDGIAVESSQILSVRFVLAE